MSRTTRPARRFTPRLTRLDDRTVPAFVGGLDPTFNGTGTAVAAFDLGGANADAAAAVAVLPDGGVVVVGSAQQPGTDVDFAVARFNPDGTLDTAFGDNGRLAIGFDLGGTNEDRATAVAVQPDGRIVVAGFARVSAAGDTDFAVVRLDPGGTLDPTFGTAGRVTIPFDLGGGKTDVAAGVGIDAFGRIVVVGTVQVDPADTDFGIARLTPAGQLDPEFGTGGRVTVAFDLGGANSDRAAAVAVQPDGVVVVAGTAQADAAGDFDFAAARLTADGKLDPEFSEDGRATVAFDEGGTNEDVATGVAIDSADRVVLAGTVAQAAAGDFDFGVARLTPEGGLDPTFNTSGRRSVAFDLGGGNADRAAGVAVDPFGRIVVAGTVDQAAAGDSDFGVVRLDDDGNLDDSFNGEGRAVVPFDLGAEAGLTADEAAGVAVQPNGRVVVAGTAAAGAAGDTDIVVARLIGGTELAGGFAAGGPRDGTARRFGTTATGYADAGTETAFPGSGAVVRTAVADVNGDGFEDYVYGVGPGGGSAVKVVLSRTTGGPVVFNAFEPSFTGGVFVAAADIDGDGKAEVIVSPDVGGGGRVQVFGIGADRSVTQLDNFFGIADPNFRGGARVAAGDIDGDGRADLVVGAGFLGGPRVAVFDGAGLLRNSADPPRLVGDFFAFPGADATRLRNGVFVAVGDVTGDGKAELIFGGGPGGGPRVYVLDGAKVTAGDVAGAQADPVANFFVAGNDAARGGVRLAVKDLDGDDRADLLAASGDNRPATVRIYRGATIPQPNGAEPPLFQEIDLFGGTLPTGVFVG